MYWCDVQMLLFVAASAEIINIQNVISSQLYSSIAVDHSRISTDSRKSRQKTRHTFVKIAKITAKSRQFI